MKRLSTLLALVLVLCLVAAAPAFAAEKDLYVSLGDSIAAGFSAAPGHSYFDLYSAHLGSGYDSANLGWPAQTSQQLLADLQNPVSPAHQLLSQPRVKVITLSIGSNDLLGPILGAVSAQYNVDPSDTAALLAFINGNQQAWQTIVAGVTVAAQPGGPLYTVLQSNEQQFISDWPQIMMAIHALAPNARVYVLTTYNPMRSGSTVGRGLDALILPMDAVVSLTPTRYRNVRVIHTNLLFALNKGALSFDLAKWPADAGSVDPHPTTLGHWLIYRAIVVNDTLFPR